MNYDLIIPIYNVENELERCLHSILCQTYGNFRAVMVDDGSEDRSSVIARSYAARDSRFEYYRKENGGLSDARNFGISKISSEYVLFIDGDDFIEADALEIIDRELCKAAVDVLEFNGWFVENGKKTGYINTCYVDEGMIKSGKNYILDNIKKRGFLAAVFLKAVRSSLILRHRLYFAKGLLHEDELWTPKLYFRAETVKYVDRRLYHYVQRENSITHRRRKDENARHIKKILYRLETYYQSLGLTRCQYRILSGYLSRQMISACRLSENEKMTPRDRAFILRNARDPVSIGKTLLFLTAPGHYDTLRKAARWIIRY